MFVACYRRDIPNSRRHTAAFPDETEYQIRNGSPFFSDRLNIRQRQTDGDCRYCHCLDSGNSNDSKVIIRNPDNIILDYGKTGLSLALDRSVADWTIILPEESPSVPDFKAAFDESANNPISSSPLIDIVSPHDRVIIVTSDNTRPVPNKLLISAIIEHCHLPVSKVTVLVGSGSHRPNTRDELIELLGEEIVRDCRIVVHDALDRSSLVSLGTTADGIPVTINKEYYEAERRIVIGFIEPHFFAGYSGGAKGICPAICGIDTIKAFHSFEIIGHPDSDFGKLELNPQQSAAREVASFAPPDFLINVLLNGFKQVTAIYSGDYVRAHEAGAAEQSRKAMVPVNQKYPIVITTNSGFPLDQNLYQTVKGIWTASRIVEEGGDIIVVSECARGLPEGSQFARILGNYESAETLLDALSKSRETMTDQWQAQKLAMVLKKARVSIYSMLGQEELKKCRMKKIDNLEKYIKEVVGARGGYPAIAVLPRGPLTIPFLE